MTSSSGSDQWVFEPQQARSRRTLQRLIDAASDILDEEPLHEVTVEQICRRAGVSVGTFYRRIQDKEALLYLLDEELAAESAEILTKGRMGGSGAADGQGPARTELNVSQAGAHSDEETEDSTEIGEAIRELVAPWVRSYFIRRGVRRALLLRSRVDPTFRERAARTEKAAAEDFAAFLTSRPEFRDSSQEEVARIAERLVLQVVGVLRETVLFREQQVLEVPQDPEETIELVTTLITGTVKASTSSPRNSPQ